MSEPPSVTEWLQQLREGDGAAAARLWERYGQALRQLAKSRHRAVLGPADDEEDLAQSVFAGLWGGVASGHMDSIQDRDELWYVLITITKYKALRRQEYQSAQKRFGKTLSIHAITEESSAETAVALASNDPPPDLAAMVEDEHERLMSLLDDPAMRRIAEMKLTGLTHQEVARELKLSSRTIIRKLSIIRDLWSRELS
ncbi:MAG: ECF-type sigma factor [Planctomycetaceae bacterium]|nr:ECF-type sigma factor [Planctomycetaceae bacterium]